MSASNTYIVLNIDSVLPGLPPDYPRATPGLPPGYPRATPGLPTGYPRATPGLPPGSPSWTPNSLKARPPKKCQKPRVFWSRLCKDFRFFVIFYLLTSYYLLLERGLGRLGRVNNHRGVFLKLRYVNTVYQRVKMTP